MDSVTETDEYRPRKKALLAAVSYAELHEKHPSHSPQLRLNGALKDPPMLQRLLIDLFGYKESDITILMNPTRKQMIEAMEDLVRDAQAGDTFFFGFSGHGSQIINLDGTEMDGLDEVIWPNDVEYDPEKPELERVTGFIMDDTLKEILVDRLPPKTRITAVLDCCHSGTGLDLEHNYYENAFDNRWASPPTSPQAENANGIEVIGTRADPERAMSLDSVAMLSRSSTMSSETGTNMKGISRGMRMPYSTRGIVPYLPSNGESIVVQEDPRVDPRRSKPNAQPKECPIALSWSACMDDQFGLDTNRGGLLTCALDRILREKKTMTNKEMLYALTEDLFNLGKRAKHFFRKAGGNDGFDFPQPKPCIGSFHPLETFGDECFTF